MSTSPLNSRPSRHPSLSGFTLIEVVFGITLLSLIVGSVFAVIRGSVDISSEIEHAQRESDSINRFIEHCRRAFTTMPASGTLTLKLVQNTEPVIQELTITGSPDCFPFGRQPISFKDTLLSLRPHPAGITDDANMPVHNLCIYRDGLQPSSIDIDAGLETTDEEGRYWMPLLPDVIAFKWRFYVEKEETWYEEWSKTEWPDLIEANLTLKNRTVPIRMVFGVPVITISAGRAPTSSSSTPAPTPAPTSTGGGGNNRGDGQNSPKPR
ncbi:MAG: prepilin-type N-terminal cleavage/methylation domain-containing protein [Verrucomicrobiaceae bacterium]|nr:prepilin-type N-terminal cleavage/methylation domain-containing protein [Verrucomicrobiaceae bacterium]